MTDEAAEERHLTPVTVRDARPDDAARIAEVAEASWRETYRDIFEPAFIDDFLRRSYSTDQLAREATWTADHAEAQFLVAERDGDIVGYLGFGEGPRGPELFRVYAHPVAYGTGVGGALLDELHRRIDGRVDAYVLDVHSRNERGRAFYDRRGFVIAGGGATPDCDLTLRRTLQPRRATLPIETERLRLRSLTADDLSGLHAMYGDADTMQFVGARGRPTDDLAASRRILDWMMRHERLHGFGLWAVDERDGEATVGVAGPLWEEGHGPEVEVVYLFRRDRWGRGYATEALRAVLERAHGELALPRVVALAYPENGASQRVMAKAGLRPDGEVTAYGRPMARFVSEPGA
jgi:ribosomal-protein-alanine N-acetyltransferase